MGKLIEIVEEHRAPSRRIQAYCTLVRRIWAIWDQFDEEDQAYVIAGLAPSGDGQVSARALARGFEAFNIKTAANRILEHRSSHCICKEAPPWAI